MHFNSPHNKRQNSSHTLFSRGAALRTPQDCYRPQRLDPSSLLNPLFPLNLLPPRIHAGVTRSLRERLKIFHFIGPMDSGEVAA